MIGRHHYHHYGAPSALTISQNDIEQLLFNIEQLFLAIFVVVSCCLMLQLFAFYYVYVTYHRVRLRLNAISPPSYEASREHPNFQQKQQQQF